MKLVLCVLAVICCALPEAATNTTTRKLREVRRELKKLKESLQEQHNGLMLNTPPQNIGDCCCIAALQCFQENLMQLNATNKIIQTVLGRSLRNPLTKRGLTFCDSGNAMHTTCQTCNSYPKNTAEAFLDTLDSLIQRGLARLMR